MQGLDSTNLQKYETRNPLARALLGRYFAALTDLVAPLDPASVLEVGCGEGEVLARLEPVLPDRVAGVDLREEALELARERLAGVALTQANAYSLDFENGEFDLVICAEVLEHLSEPGAAIAELARVARRDVVISVPWEPWFRLGSLARGKWVSSLGNHPEHVHRWGPSRFAELLRARLDVVSLRSPFPWLLAHSRPR
jgi:ubiquinone/menaquinone biosynthesis C-methylase UbiE